MYQDFLPRGSSELTCSFFPTSNNSTNNDNNINKNIFTSTTITIDFTPANAECGSGAGSINIHSALLLTLSPLHRVSAVRVLVQNKKKNGDDSNKSTAEWHQLQLDSSIFYKTQQRIVSGAARQQQQQQQQQIQSLTAVSSLLNEDIKEKEKEEKEEVEIKKEDENDGIESDTEVLELVLGSSDDENDNENDNNIDMDNTTTNEELMSSKLQQIEEKDDMATQFMLKLWPNNKEGIDTEEESNSLNILQCCINVELIPTTELVGMSIPFLTILSTIGINSNDGYMLLAGQRFYDYFISPRVAYTETLSNDVSFTSIDVLITSLQVVQDNNVDPWEIVPLTSMPVLPENLLCAFVRPQLESSGSLFGMEFHAGVKWRVQHYPAYTYMSSTLEEETEKISRSIIRFYFFHCDHILCECLLPLIQIANSAWETVQANRTNNNTISSCDETTWVVTSNSNTLLRLRRGVLCVRGGVLLTIDTLRAICSPHTLTVHSHVDALRAKVLLFSAALEIKWRAVNSPITITNSTITTNTFTINNTNESMGIPEFNTMVLSAVSFTRAWAFCLCCDEPGWTELLQQERRIAACGLHTVVQTDPWCLMQKYMSEVRQTLLLLSSTSAVISMRQQRCFPWELMEKENDILLSKWIAEMNVIISYGMHLDLVRLLLQQEWNGPQGDTSPVPIPLLASLAYEVKPLHKKVYRDILLHMRFPKLESTRGVVKNKNETTTHQMWGIDIPFTLLDFTVEGAETSLLTINTPVRKEQAIHCCVAQTIPGYWRVSGLAWIRGLDQQTTFSLLQSQKKEEEEEEENNNNNSNEDKKNNTNIGMRGDDHDDTDGNKKKFRVQLPLLVLNPKDIPAALLVRVQHNQFWSNLSTLIDIHTRRAILEYIMEQAVKEGETTNIEESKLIFTPLLNQLLESLLDWGPQQQENHSISLNTTKITPLLLFFTALRNVHLDEKFIWCQIYSDTHARLSYYLSRHHFPSFQLSDGGGKQENPGSNHNSNNNNNNNNRIVSDVETKFLQHLRTITSYYDSLPPKESQPREQNQQSQRPRLVLGLRNKMLLARKENKKDEAEEEEKKMKKNNNNKERKTPSNPTELVEMISRVITETSKSKDDTALAARRAALSLSIPLWLLLQGSPELMKDRKGNILLKAQELYESLRNTALASAGDSDTVLMKVYEGFCAKH